MADDVFSGSGDRTVLSVHANELRGADAEDGPDVVLTGMKVQTIDTVEKSGGGVWVTFTSGEKRLYPAAMTVLITRKGEMDMSWFDGLDRNSDD